MDDATGAIGEERRRHRKILHDLERQFWPLFLSSLDGVFIFLDDEHKVTSDKAAELFGYEKYDFERLMPFIYSIVAPEDRDAFEAVYYENIVAERIPAQFEFMALHRDGHTIPVKIVMVPISHGEPDLLFTLCFVKK